MEDCSEHSDEHIGFIKCEEVLEKRSDWHLLKDLAPWCQVILKVKKIDPKTSRDLYAFATPHSAGAFLLSNGTYLFDGNLNCWMDFSIFKN